jgi:hypothetical protein
MMLTCGNVAESMPALVEDGLDVLNLVQTRAVAMDLVGLRPCTKPPEGPDETGRAHQREVGDDEGVPHPLVGKRVV